MKMCGTLELMFSMTSSFADCSFIITFEEFELSFQRFWQCSSSPVTNGVFSYFEYNLSSELKSKFLKSNDRQRMLRVGKIVRSLVEERRFGYQQVWLNLPAKTNTARRCRDPKTSTLRKIF